MCQGKFSLSHWTMHRAATTQASSSSSSNSMSKWTSISSNKCRKGCHCRWCGLHLLVTMECSPHRCIISNLLLLKWWPCILRCIRFLTSLECREIIDLNHWSCSSLPCFSNSSNIKVKFKVVDTLMLPSLSSLKDNLMLIPAVLHQCKSLIKEGLSKPPKLEVIRGRLFSTSLAKGEMTWTEGGMWSRIDSGDLGMNYSSRLTRRIGGRSKRKRRRTSGRWNMEEVPSSSSHQKTKRNLSLNLSSNSLFTTCLLLRRCHRLQMETCQDKITLTVASMPHQASIPSSNKHNLVTVE